MALRDQPYLPLFVDDLLTDEKLIECSAASTGVYTKILCLMHKSKTYGKLILKQKYKQTESKIENFAIMLDNALNFKLDVIHAALIELLDEEVVYIDGDCLCQKRMIKDNELSEKRAEAGSNGGRKSKKTVQEPFNDDFIDPTEQIEIDEFISKTKAKVFANTVNGYVIVNDNEIDKKSEEEILREKKFCDEILAFFGFNEINHFKNFVLFRQAYRLFDAYGNLEHFMQQCQDYKKYIEHTGEKYRHRFEKFLGKQEEGFQGIWNDENWSDKLQNSLKEAGSDTVFLYSRKHELTLQGKDLSEYWAKLRSYGYSPKKDNRNNVIDWVKQAS